MKKVVAVLMVLMVVGSAVGACADYYTAYGKVTEIDENTWVMVIRTNDGNEWECQIDDEWWVNDVVRVLFDDMGTDSIYDDEIVNVHYIAPY